MKRLLLCALVLCALALCACEAERESLYPVSSAIAVLESRLSVPPAPALNAQSPDGATYFSKLFEHSKSPTE